ncbi:MAG: cation transporter [Clostridiales bacterium]|nr:cation transporter [Clostridiales bacterium]
MSQAQQLHPDTTRARAGLCASLLGLVLNALLAASKMVVGSLSGAVSIFADGINNLSDTGSVLISLLSLHLARKPGDRDHPYGHGRMEYIGTLGIAVIILYAGIDLLRRSIAAIAAPQAPHFNWLLAGITALSLPVKGFMWWYNQKQGKAHKLVTLQAAAQDSRNDVLITTAVLLGFLAAHLFNILLDGWLGLLVSAFILFSGIQLIRETITSLIGGRPDRELGQRVLAIIQKHPEITGVHDFVLHDYGPGRTMASIHVEVPAHVRLLDIHEVVDLIEQEVMQELNLPIAIHMDPTLPEDAPGQQVKASIEAFLSAQQPPMSLHDFRVVPGKRVIKLIFDVVVPADDHDESLVERISAYARTLDPRHVCVIGLDRDYFTHDQGTQEDA